MENKKNMSVIIPGSYDPVTFGHLDIIERAAEEYSEVYAVIFVNPKKEYTFSLDERVKMLMLATDHLDNCIVSYSNGLVIDYMREHDIEKIVKGYRNDVDYEYEMTQARWNLKNGGYDTLLLPADEKYRDISSTEVRRRLKLGEDVSSFLPKSVIDFISKH